MRIYVASSWRNDYQPDVVRALRELDHEVYDFRNPAPGKSGFNWRDIDPAWQKWSLEEYLAALEHPIAENGFARDWEAMLQSDACVLLLPSGRSAHLEAGYFVGAKKPLWILGNGGEPELMYKMASRIFAGVGPLLLHIQAVEDATPGIPGSVCGDGQPYPVA